MDYNITSKIMGTGMTGLDKMGQDLAKTIDTVDSNNQVDMIKLQQQIASYSNTVSMMSNMLKNLSDTDKEVIRSM